MTYIIDNLISRYPSLGVCRDKILEAYSILEQCVKDGNKILIAGNGGSSSDSDHIVGELMKSFVRHRNIDSTVHDRLEAMGSDGSEIASTLEGTIRAINLMQHNSLTSAYSNDKNPAITVAQQVYGYGDSGDVYIGISTSGDSKNIVYGAMTAKAKEIKVIALTGAKSSKIDCFSDVSIKVPETETYRIQELHLPVYHALCLMLEERFF